MKKCDKKRFKSRGRAKKYLKILNRNRTYGKNQKSVYHCDICDCYHTSSMSKEYYLKRKKRAEKNQKYVQEKRS